MTAKEAYSSFMKKHPGLTVTEAAEYDDKYFLFVAVEDPDRIDYGDPFYLIDRKTGEIKNFSPIDDLDKFEEALDERDLSINMLKV